MGVSSSLHLKGRSSSFAKNQRNLWFCSSLLCISCVSPNSTNSKRSREKSFNSHDTKTLLARFEQFSNSKRWEVLHFLSRTLARNNVFFLNIVPSEGREQSIFPTWSFSRDECFLWNNNNNSNDNNNNNNNNNVIIIMTTT